MNLLDRSSYNYILPKELIAQYPLSKRETSRMMVLDKSTQRISHKTFSDILDYLNAGDVLVLNNSKVIPARLYGKKETGGSVELFLLHKDNSCEWSCLVKPGKGIVPGSRIKISDNLSAEIISKNSEGIVRVRFDNPENSELTYGNVPLPPYIHRDAEISDTERYQTVYAKHEGSVAAPTAGLHFTESLLEQIKNKGVEITEITLHVGLGTFKAVSTDKINDHKMHAELCEISRETANTINEAKKKGGRILSVGTTTTRTLESFYSDGQLAYGTKWTDIFLYPGQPFNVIDAQLTNFHMPESSLIMLVAGFAGYEFTMKAYDTAIAEKYRFFSYGDCMLVYN